VCTPLIRSLALGLSDAAVEDCIGSRQSRRRGANHLYGLEGQMSTGLGRADDYSHRFQIPERFAASLRTIVVRNQPSEVIHNLLFDLRIWH